MKKMRVALALLISAFTACFTQAANVAKVGNTEYATISAAIDAVQDGETIELLSDITVSGYFVYNKSFTIDGKGKTITCASANTNYPNYFVNVANGYAQTFKNVTINANEKVPYAIQCIGSTSKLTLDNVTVQGGKTMKTKGKNDNYSKTRLGYGIHVNQGTVIAKDLTVKNCTVLPVYLDGTSSSVSLSGDKCNLDLIGTAGLNETVSSSAKGFYAYEVTASYKFIWTSTKEVRVISSLPWNEVISKVGDYTDITVLNATVKLLQDVVLSEPFTSNNTKLTIDGNNKVITGTIKFTTSPSTIKNAVLGEGTTLDCTASTTMGFSSVSVAANATIDILLPSTTDISKYSLPVSLGANAIANITVGDKKYIAKGDVITPAETLAQVGDKQYATLQAAIDAANGATIHVLKDVALTASLNIPAGKTLTLNLAGRKVTITGADYALINNGTLTIIDQALVAVVEETSAQNDDVVSFLITCAAANDGVVALDDATGGSIAGVQNKGTFALESGVVVAASASVPAIDNTANAVATITGGTVDGKLQSVDKSALTVTGGSFTGNSNVSDFVGGNYGVDDNGTVISYVAQLGATKYQTLQEAFAAAKEFDVVTVLDAEAEVSGIAGYVAEGLFPINNGDNTFTVRTKPNATVAKIPAFTLVPEKDRHYVWGGDTSLSEDTEARPLDVVMNFKANDDEEGARASGFNLWKCDFYLTFSGMSGASIEADKCYLAGNYGGYGWIVILADDTIIDNNATIPVVAIFDDNITYRQICTEVKKFTAAIYMDRDLLAANPDLQVTLALKMKNPIAGVDQELVVGSYTYDVAAMTGENAPTVKVDETVNTGTTTEEQTAFDAFKTTVANALTEAYQATEEKLDVEVIAKDEGSATFEITAEDYEMPEEGLEMTFPVEAVEDGQSAIIVHKHEGKAYVFTGVVEYGFVTYTNKLGFSEFSVGNEAALKAALAEGDTIVLTSDVTLTEDLTLPAGITLNGNGKSITGATVWADGNLTFVGHTKMQMFNAGYNKPTITIGAGACLELTGSGRMVIGHGATFNITGTIADAKTANVADITPSLIAAGASFTGAGVNFNVNNAYVKFTAYCSSKNSSANGTFNINVTNSIWEQTGSLVFTEPTSGKDPTFNFNVVNSVLNSTSHLVFGVTKGEIVFDNSNVNVGTSRQIENRSTMIVKNGSVVNGAVATSSNAKNPGTVVVENATYAVTGEFSGSDLGTGTLIVKKGANVTMGKITKANIQIDATDMTEGELANFTANLSGLSGTLTVVNNDKLEASIVDGKIVLAKKPVAQIGETKYATLEDAFKAATSGCTITLLNDVVVDYYWDCRNTGAKFTVPVTIEGNGKTIKFTNTVYDGGNYMSAFRFEDAATVKNLTIDMSEALSGFAGRFRAISAKGNLTVDKCTFIGNGSENNTRAIIFGEGAGTATADVVVSITNSTFTGWKRGVSDNENAQDAKSVTLTGNAFTDANVGISASESVVFTDNTVAEGCTVGITSYTGYVSVVAKDNTMPANEKTFVSNATNYDNIQGEFAIVANVSVTRGETTKYYNTLDAAFAAAQDGDTITLLADVALDATLTTNKAVTINGNGKKITTAAGFVGNGSNAMIDIQKNITFNNVVFDGVKTVAVMRAVSANVTMDDCVVQNCQHTVGQGLLRLACGNATITDSKFLSNTCTMVVSFGYDAANDADVLTVDNCVFEGNTCCETAVLYFADGDYGKVTNTKFVNNVVTSAGNAATLYMGWGDGFEVRGCLFEGNSVTTTHAATKRFASAIFCDGCAVTNNAFINNTATRNGQAVSTTVAVGAYYGAADVSANYWGKPAPEAGTDFTIEYTRNPVAFESYYTSYENGVLGGFEKCATGKVAYRAYVTNTESRNAVQIDLENLYAKESVVVKLLDANGNVLTMTTLKAGGAEAANFTVNVVLWGNPSGSWDTEIKQTLTVENAPATIQLWLDGKLCDTFENAMGDKMNDYLAMGCVYKAASIGATYYATLQAALDAAQGGETIILLADVNEGVSISGKKLTLDLNGKKAYCANSDTVAVSAGAEVSIKNGTLESAGNNCGGVWVKNAKATLEDCTFIGVHATQSCAVYASNGATVTIDNCELTANHYALIMMGANVTINGGTFTAPTSVSANGSNDYDDATLTIKDGTFNGGIYWPANGKLTIDGGTFTADTAVYVKSGSLEINGGIFTGNGEAKDYEYKDSGFNATGAAIVIENVGVSEYDAVVSVAITGGTFTSVNNVAIQSVTAGHDGVEAAKNFISGGTFSSDVSNLCAPNFIVQGNGIGGFGVVQDPAYGKLAKIGDTYYTTVAEALTAAKAANMTDVTITLMGDTVKTTTDSFDLVYTTLFNSVTFKQADATKTYYLYDLYTGVRTNGGKFIFDGVNIVVTDQYMFEGNVKLINNSTITSTAEANCFIYNGTTTIEPGSKLKGVIDDFRGGKVIVDGGKTDGTYNETPDMQDAILIVNWSGDSLTLKNGAYVKVNAANEVGRLTLNAGTSANITASKLEAYQDISIAGGASMNLDAASLVTTQKITGAGTITIDATGFTGPAKTIVKADMSGFTGTINVTGNPLAKYAVTSEGLVLEEGLSGEGTEASPFLIGSLDELKFFRDSVNAGETKYNAPGVWVALGADIDMAGTEWTEGIGDGHEWSFDGNFDGKNHTIKNLTIKPYADTNKYLCGGLFGYTCGAVTIKNVILENVTVDCGSAEGHNVGALVGFANNNGGMANISGITVKGAIAINAPNVYGVGAIVGYSYRDMGTIDNCKVIGTNGSYIKGYSFVGGITGYSYSNATITNCSVENVTISGTSYSVGGIAGIVLAGNTISNCSVDATINGQANVGAIVGALSTDTVTLDNCMATGSLPEVGGNYSNNAAFEARVGNKYYTSLANAIAAANAGETITLVRDVTSPETITISKSITINGNGKNVLPADVNQTYNSAFMVGDSGWGDDHGEVITVKNVVFEGWKTNHGVVRAQGVTLAMDGCEFNACSASNAAYAVLSLNFTDATIANTKFVNNSSRAIDVNYNGDTSKAVVTIEGCTFDGNTTTGAGIVMRSNGTIAVKNSVFKNNTVNTNGNGATVYVGFGSGNEVSGCLFEDNRVMSSLATTKRFASAIFCDGCVVNGNIFGEGNTATRNGETIATVVAVGAYYGAADINGNYWMGKEPVPGVDYTIEYTRNPVAMETYIPSYSTDANGDVVLADQVTIGYVAKTAKYGYKTLAEAIAAANAGDTITLIRDTTTVATIKIEKSITLDGNGKTLTYTGLDRAIEMPNNAADKLNVTIKNLTVDCTASYCQRGVNYNDDGALTLEGVTVKGTNVTYALNLPGSSDNATVVINDSALSGNIALNVWGENATITATNTVFTSVDNATAENYTAIALNNDGTTSAEGTTVAINGGQIIALNEKGELSNAIRNATSTGTVNVSDTTVVNGNYTKPVAIVDYGTDQFYSCATLQQAIDKAIATKGSVKLLTDTEVSEIITINGAVVIDLNGKTVKGTAKKVFEVYANATIKNGTINGANRCVDTRKAVELTLTDVTLVADQYTAAYGNPQPLTIGGSEDGTKVTMSNVNISAEEGYGIITFVKTDLTATDSTINGYSALYVKPGSEESTFAFAKSTLSGSTASNDVEGNSFSAIAIRANTVAVTMDADSTLTATGNFCHALSLGGSYEGETTVANASVTIAGTIDGNIFSVTTLNSNTIKVKAEYADDLLAEGYCTGNVDANGLVVVMGKAPAKIGDTYYATVEEALAAASNGTRVTVMNREAAVAFGDKLGATGNKVGADAYDVATLLGGSFEKDGDKLVYEYAFGVSNVAYVAGEAEPFKVTIAIKDADSTADRTLTGRTLVLCMVVEGDESTPDVITEIKKVKPTFVAADGQVTFDVSVNLPAAGEGKATYFTVKVTDEK